MMIWPAPEPKELRKSPPKTSKTFSKSLQPSMLLLVNNEDASSNGESREGLVGDYDYGFLFRPNLPFMRKRRTPAPFFGLNDSIPVTLMILLGFQHALAMLAGIITPPMLVAGQSGANLDPELTQYLVSAALIISGILSALQIKRFHIPKTPFNFGTGMLTVVGTSFTSKRNKSCAACSEMIR